MKNAQSAAYKSSFQNVLQPIICAGTFGAGKMFFTRAISVQKYSLIKIKPSGPSLPRLPTIHVVRLEGSSRCYLRKENITVCYPQHKGLLS